MLNALLIINLFALAAHPNELVTGDYPVAGEHTDTLYNEYHESTYCSPPPTRSSCPANYNNLAASNPESLSIMSSNNSRPCFVSSNSKSPAMRRPGPPHPEYSIYSSSAPNVFEVDIPITFNLSKIPASSRINSYNTFIQRAQQCLQNPGFKISDGTRELKFNLIPEIKSQTSTRSFSNSIVTLHETLDRENSANYSLGINCSTLVHETLHILGLHDEYHEEIDRYTPNQSVFEQELGINLPTQIYEQGLVNQGSYDCRQTANDSNIMNDHTFFDLGGPPQFIVLQCKDSHDTGIVQSLSLKEGARCPSNYSDQYQAAIYSSMEKVNAFYKMARETVDREQRTTLDLLLYYRRTSKNLPPTLNSRQFDQILNPNCMSKPGVRTYLSRSQNAYRNRYSEQPEDRCIK